MHLCFTCKDTSPNIQRQIRVTLYRIHSYLAAYAAIGNHLHCISWSTTTLTFQGGGDQNQSKNRVKPDFKWRIMMWSGRCVNRQLLTSFPFQLASKYVSVQRLFLLPLICKISACFQKGWNSLWTKSIQWEKMFLPAIYVTFLFFRAVLCV